MGPSRASSVDHVLPSLGRDGWDRLDSLPPDLIDRLSAQYRSAAPFPHLIIDNLFDPEMLQEIERGFENVAPEFWSESRHRLQSKRSTLAAAPLPDPARYYFNQLHSGPMCRFLSAITGVEALHGDPMLVNGGLHEVSKGGHFDLHIDFAYHPKTRWRSRLVVITYLNKGWVDEYGGALELWNWKPRQLAASVLPVFGRSLIMEVGPHNVHGHPRSVATPTAMTRRSLASYFYTDADDKSEGKVGDITAYVDRPDAPLDQRLLRMVISKLPSPAIGAARALFGRR